MMRSFALVVFLLCLPGRGYTASFAKARTSKKGKAKASKPAKAGGGFGGGGGGFGSRPPATAPLQSFGDPGMDAAVADRCAALRKMPNSPKIWLELGSLMVKSQEYSEAERAFRVGAHRAPDNEMLSAAALSLGGDSAAYCRSNMGDAAAAAVDLSDSNFDGFQAAPDEILSRDQADRAVDWKAAGSDLHERGAVFRSRGPLLDPDDCAWVIREVEAHCAVHGWTTDRHVQAPTTDVPVSQVPAIREWFDKALRTTLLPMLASRYPRLIPGADCLRVMDAFVVRYDAREQASLPMHQDENTFS